MYKLISELKDKNINFQYTPFKQSAMTESLDSNWEGSCNVLAHSWMIRKISIGNMQDSASYRIDHPCLPHPVIGGDNNPEGQDIKSIRQKLNKIREIAYTDRYTLEREMNNSNTKGVDTLVDYIASNRYHYGFIEVAVVLKMYSNEFKTPAHVVAFVKRENNISFFDANHGEITFQTTEDFRFWLEKEIKEGLLRFLDRDINNKKGLTKADIFPPYFPEKNNVSEHIKEAEQEFDKLKAERKTGGATWGEVLVVGDYSIESFKSDRYCNPDAASEQEEIQPIISNTSKRKTECKVENPEQYRQGLFSNNNLSNEAQGNISVHGSSVQSQF